jgi:hypothetical protein
VQLSALRLIYLDRLCHNEEANRATHLASSSLQLRKFTPYTAASWDEPAIAAFSGEDCVAVVNYSYDEKQHTANVDFAFCSRNHPTALAMCLLGLRKKLREKPINYVRFTHHVGNEEMERAVAKLGLTPFTMSYRVPASMFGKRAA